MLSCPWFRCYCVVTKKVRCGICRRLEKLIASFFMNCGTLEEFETRVCRRFDDEDKNKEGGDFNYFQFHPPTLTVLTCRGYEKDFLSVADIADIEKTRELATKVSGKSDFVKDAKAHLSHLASEVLEKYWWKDENENLSKFSANKLWKKRKSKRVGGFPRIVKFDHFVYDVDVYN